MYCVRFLFMLFYFVFFLRFVPGCLLCPLVFGVWWAVLVESFARLVVCTTGCRRVVHTLIGSSLDSTFSPLSWHANQPFTLARS